MSMGLPHAESQPNLVNIHEIKDNSRVEIASRNNSENSNEQREESPASDSEEEVDLLEYLTTIDYSYRDIKFRIPNKENHSSDTRKNYQKRVSFDTINLQYDTHDDLYGVGQVDDLYKYDISNDRGRSKSRSPAGSPLHSPSVSPERQSLRGSLDLGGMDLTRILSNYHQPNYPTVPIITHKGCTFTKVHKNFENLYLNKLNNKENNYRKPILPHRVILVYITARKHTWVALDWVLNLYIEDGDSVIIVSAVNLLSMDNRRRSSAFTSPDKIIAKAPKARLRARNRPEYVKIISKNLMSYAMEIINPNVIAKVSIEIAVGKSKQILQEMYKLYEPNLVCTGSKPTINFSAPLRSWTSSKVTDRMVKNYPLPAIIVPAVNMGKFESNLSKAMDIRYKFAVPEEEEVEKPLKLAKLEKEIEDDASVGSILSEDSYSSFDEITRSYERYKGQLQKKLKDCSEGGYNESYFTNCLKIISDESAGFCRDVKGIDPDFRGRGAKLARVLTGSNSFGIVPYKTKSLLPPIEKPKPPPSSSDTPSISYKQLKKQLKEKQRQQTQDNLIPKISVISPPKSPDVEASPPPPKQTLKFDLATPADYKTKNMPQLQKSFSGEDQSNSFRPKLEPLKSHPDLHDTYASKSNEGGRLKDKKGKKKSSRFWKLFN